MGIILASIGKGKGPWGKEGGVGEMEGWGALGDYWEGNYVRMAPGEKGQD
mgnify:CR=1 FL=1